jgi:trypsin
MMKRKGQSSGSMCGAVLISEKFALTAAHCTYGRSTKDFDFTLSAGKHVLHEDEPMQQDRLVRKIYTHENYQTGKNELNDIALLQFEPLKFDAGTQPIKLPGAEFKIDLGKNPKGIVSGWGCTHEGCGGSVARVLQEVAVPLMDNKDCEKAYGNIAESMLCAAEAEGGKDSCQGDSGGPMVLEEGTEKTLIGLVSWGEGCACKGQPGVYTRVTSFIKWIKDGMNEKLTDDSLRTNTNNGQGTGEGGDKESHSNHFKSDIWTIVKAYVVICVLATIF